MPIVIKDCVVAGNGRDGIRLPKDGDVVIESTRIYGNQGEGISIEQTSPAGLMQALGLPSDTDPALLVDLIRRLQFVSSAERESTIRSSELWRKTITVLANTSEFIANIITISGAPQIAAWLHKWGSQ